ncbi:hypothetical protein AGMMS49938_11130 [Fibrobacterales bacterium]|nr:hypothetical protein AGMMS49938_11130 [Fibrobacterales bacterium]
MKYGKLSDEKLTVKKKKVKSAKIEKNAVGAEIENNAETSNVAEGKNSLLKIREKILNAIAVIKK